MDSHIFVKHEVNTGSNSKIVKGVTTFYSLRQVREVKWFKVATAANWLQIWFCYWLSMMGCGPPNLISQLNRAIHWIIQQEIINISRRGVKWVCRSVPCTAPTTRCVCECARACVMYSYKSSVWVSHWRTRGPNSGWNQTLWKTKPDDEDQLTLIQTRIAPLCARVWVCVCTTRNKKNSTCKLRTFLGRQLADI